MLATKESEKVSTTVRLPRLVYNQAKAIVDNPASSVASFNEFILVAVLSYIKMARRKQIDMAFKGMAEDTDFQKESKIIAEEFEQSDWEALESAEMEVVGSKGGSQT